MKTIKKISVYFLLTAIVMTSLTAVKAYQNTIAPIEKIYTQTDRPFYFPGETLWFKSYIVTENNTVSNLSDVAHAQLISPKGAVVKSLRLSIKDGYAYGDFDINTNWVGGIYTLKVYTNWMRNFGENTFFTKQITVQKVVKPNLLLTLEFQKEGYGKNSKVIADFEVKDLKNNPLANTEITYEVSVKGQKISTQNAVTDSEGKINPTFTLPKDLVTTDVVLNVLIPYKGSTESISRSVPVALDNIDFQLFPESGQIIAGTNNTIAFKAINEFTKPVDVSGDILDSNGRLITTFSSFHDGMGSFILNAKEGEVYTAKLKTPFVSERAIALPKVQKEGTRFSVETEESMTKIILFSTEKKSLRLEVSSASKVLLQKKISNKESFISINTEDFPMGITKFSITNNNNQIVAERLVFVNPHKQLNVDIDLEKTVYETRERVKLKINTTDGKGLPLPSNLSIAVADNKLLSFADDKQDHILSYLLVSSELKGKIHKPSFYLNPKKEKSAEALDYLMLTHGWRNYIVDPKVTLENAEFLPEQHAIQSGTVVDKKGKPITAHLLLMDRLGHKIHAFDTENDGTFTFKFTDSQHLVLLAYRDDRKSVFIKKTNFINGRYQHHKDATHKENVKRIKTFDKEEKPLKKKILKEAEAIEIALTEDSSQLDEVVIVGYRTTSKSSTTASVVVVAEESLSNASSVVQLLQGQVAGINITTSNGAPGANSTVQLRGVGSISGNIEPLFIVDGVPVDESVFRNLNPSDLHSISVIKDAGATAIYGSRGSNGVIVIQTNSGGYINNSSKKKLNNAKFNNYGIANFQNSKPSRLSQAKEFYVPVYVGGNTINERTDFRQTIYWNPVVQTDENGQAEVEFYNNDAITSFKITTEGVGFNGMIGRQEETYATKKLLNIDFKSPNYMALKDDVVLPLTITNETDKDITTDIEIILPKQLKFAENYDRQVTVNANSSVLRNVRVVPIEKAENATLEVRINSETLSDVVKRNVTVLSPYFPTQTSISGSKSGVYQFDINSVVDGSLSANFNIYTDVIGDVMNGIESLIRAPYGCFEQTSSSTYPNIMVLQYLKESGKSNPEIEAKALDFIDKGYKRLIGFETKDGGFEWFGKTPPHETLTAYGILEFTEMKQVYGNVDQAMIDRTVQWLMSRKDGEGGFKKSTKGYDSFASSPADVANAYIVYAISEAGIDVDLNLEYEAAYKDALKSKDAYKMAMMALASYNLDKPENASTLISKLKDQIFKNDFKGLPVENTITRSYGNAKHIETTAFTLLALMREAHADKTLISKGIEYLVGLRKHDRFGSTQSTAMALKALINYTKMQKQLIIKGNDTVELTINGQSLKRRLSINDQGKIVIDSLATYFKQGQQKIQVQFANDKVTFPYCLTINWDSYVPDSSSESPLKLETKLLENKYKVGDNVSMTIHVSNIKEEPLGMVTSIIGIPSGTTAQPWQLKELLEKEKVAYYEVFDNYLVFYWRFFRPSETKTIRLDLKADIAGDYQAPASTTYLYYGDEYKTWIEGNTIEILN
ncbi:TonB-dependent receptor plug domain-containing protein [uncultured Psychroserpens sp.]|uniref:TonB-dependent receptor plug domain-containing protein n=1 Tax=uncultured Psychroserpens sp. TaxID=255436 RepID=UPI0026305422|nr:TonB-dependent receptor plug domain-containing protein [uncultured Psychroserpens sp.]